jgi:tetratricopeptide (TPR) repeat protein
MGLMHGHCNRILLTNPRFSFVLKRCAILLPSLLAVMIGICLTSFGYADTSFADKYNNFQHEVRAGKASFEKGLYQDAIIYISKALEKSPFEASLYHERGISYYRLGDCEKAREDFDRTILLDSRKAPAYVYRGLCMEKNGDYLGAIQDYTSALQFNPKDANTNNNLAWLYATAKDQKFYDKEKALQYAQKAAALSERKNAEILDTLARAFFINGRISDAIETEREALKLSPGSDAFEKNLIVYEKVKGL